MKKNRTRIEAKKVKLPVRGALRLVRTRVMAMLVSIPALFPVQIYTSSLSLAKSNSPSDQRVCERQMVKASTLHHVPLGVLYAVGMTETGNKGSLHPYALNIEGKTVFTSSANEALRVFKRSRSDGVKLIDLGCMQINHHYHGTEFTSVEAMLDPWTNVDYAAKFLSELREREGSWTMAVARYHAGPDNNPAQKRYVCTVIRNLIGSGFGAWTPASKDFCR